MPKRPAVLVSVKHISASKVFHLSGAMFYTASIPTLHCCHQSDAALSH